MRKRNVIIFTVVFPFAVAASYRVGIEATKDEWAESLESVQAMLAFNRLRQYQTLSTCSAHDHVVEALEILKMSTITQKELIAGFLQTHESGPTVDYLSLRYPEGI